MEERNGNKQENEVCRMKLLDKIKKWFFKTAIEVNVDWREVALDTNQENLYLKDNLKEVNQRYHDKCIECGILYQRIADLEKLLEV